ncbi:MAG: winged helix DNA-binding protein [Sphingobium sp.]|uniref:winged helix DNA-binding protein n=1 Tax=Sphingobium sp. TaxID=1912891 RepID=UPI0029AC9A61|nr:winged helix DNA-binding protein [Sphingobium sp.]MDX3908379.1 winged helix DNA-binding protein [Sphingobium sp.]
MSSLSNAGVRIDIERNFGMANIIMTSRCDTPDTADTIVYSPDIIPCVPDWIRDKRSSLLIITSSTEGAWDAVATASDARGLGRVTHAEAVERLSSMVDVDAVVLDCSNGESDIEALASRLLMLAREQETALVIETTLDRLDAHVAAWEPQAWTDMSVQWLCDPTPAGRAEALAKALHNNRAAAVLHDSKGEQHNDRLDQLSHEVQRLSLTLESLRLSQAHAFEDGTSSTREPRALRKKHRGDWPEVSDAPFPAFANSNGTLTAMTVQELLRARRLRDQFFGGDLFADPAWDMILDLMAARLSGERVSVSSLCIAAAVPPTTALRWIRHLTQAGIFERRPDTQDGRRVFIALSDKAAIAVHRWFAAVVPPRAEEEN